MFNAKNNLIIFLIIIVIFIICMLAIFFEVGYEKVLTISNQETGEIYIERRVESEDTIEYKWIHSFEHIPWTEKFKIMDNHHLLLYEMTVAGFGAGIPENKGNVRIENGIIIMSDIKQEFEKINWINSNTALTYIKINDEIVIKGSEMPHHEPIKLIIKEKFSVWEKF